MASSDNDNVTGDDSEYESDVESDDQLSDPGAKKCRATPKPGDPPKKGNPVVWMDIGLDNSDKRLGRLVMELFADEVPKTAENFRSLCLGEKGIGEKTGKRLHYEGCTFHRVIKNFMIQGGDFENGDGTGGESIYGPKFDDEGLDSEAGPLKHDRIGLLSMANSGPNTNGSQFFITLKACPHLDGKHVVFGRVLKGFGVLKEVGEMKTDSADRPLKPVVILSCGEFPTGTDTENFGVAEMDGADVYPNYPEDLDLKFHLAENFDKVVSVCSDIKDAGNGFYNSGDPDTAVVKYRKACRYISHLRDAMGSTEDEEEAKIRAVEVPVILNIALIMLAKKNWDEAKKECNKVLEVDGNNVKALFRRGKARIGTRDFEEALADLKKVLKLEPYNKDALKEIATAKKAKMDYVNLEKQLYSKMLK